MIEDSRTPLLSKLLGTIALVLAAYVAAYLCVPEPGPRLMHYVSKSVGERLTRWYAIGSFPARAVRERLGAPIVQVFRYQRNVDDYSAGEFVLKEESHGMSTLVDVPVHLLPLREGDRVEMKFRYAPAVTRLGVAGTHVVSLRKITAASSATSAGAGQSASNP